MKKTCIALTLVALWSVYHAAASAFNPTESSITLIFNQPKYAPGDTAFFSGTLSPSIVNPNLKRQIVSLMLYGEDQDRIVHQRFSFTNGFGFGQLVIPQNASPGAYTLVGYAEDYITPLPVFLTAPFIVADKDRQFEVKETMNSAIGESDTFEIKLSKEVFATREEVDVYITALTGEGLKEGRYSVTVYKDELFTHQAHEFDNHAIMLSASGPTERKPGARALYYFRGRVYRSDSGQAVPDSTHITFYLNDNDFIFGVYTRRNGEFEFPLFSDFDNEEVFYTVWHREDHLPDAVIELHDPRYSAGMDNGATTVADPYGTYMFQKKVLMSSYQFYQSKKVSLTREHEGREFPESDIEVDLGKYEPFATMGEVFGNIVPMVRYRKSKDASSLRVFLQKDAVYAGADPLFVVDGIMTDNIQYVLSLDPSRVKRIGVLRTEYMLSRFGKLGVSGIIAIQTRIADHNTLLPRTRHTAFVTGITKSAEFSQVSYTKDQVQGRVPDLRPTLYWNPVLIPDQSGDLRCKFFTSDDTGYYSIFVHGTDAKGKPVYGHRKFLVRYQ